MKNSQEERAEYRIQPRTLAWSFLSIESHSSLAGTVEERSLTGALAKIQTSSFICLTLLHNHSLLLPLCLSTFPFSLSLSYAPSRSHSSSAEIWVNGSPRVHLHVDLRHTHVTLSYLQLNTHTHHPESSVCCLMLQGCGYSAD